MKKNITLILLSVLFILFAGNASAQQAKVEFEDGLRHDFGEVYEGDSAVHYFVFKNVGTVPLKIKEVKTTCSCTASDWPAYPIAPGEKGSIRVEFDTKNKEAGPYAKGVNMYSNAGETNMLIFITIVKK